MDTIHAEARPTPHVDQSIVRVVRTLNSIYIVVTYANLRLGKVTCVEGTFAGESYTYDPVNSQPVQPERCMILRVVDEGREGDLITSIVQTVNYA